MGPSKDLVDALFWERVRRAQKMSGDEKVREGLRLYDRALAIMRDGIRHQFPQAEDAEVETILRERLARLRKMEEPT